MQEKPDKVADRTQRRRGNDPPLARRRRQAFQAGQIVLGQFVYSPQNAHLAFPDKPGGHEFGHLQGVVDSARLCGYLIERHHPTAFSGFREEARDSGVCQSGAVMSLSAPDNRDGRHIVFWHRRYGLRRCDHSEHLITSTADSPKTRPAPNPSMSKHLTQGPEAPPARFLCGPAGSSSLSLGAE